MNIFFAGTKTATVIHLVNADVADHLRAFPNSISASAFCGAKVPTGRNWYIKTEFEDTIVCEACKAAASALVLASPVKAVYQTMRTFQNMVIKARENGGLVPCGITMEYGFGTVAVELQGETLNFTINDKGTIETVSFPARFERESE
jgi:hypothetical protein